MKKVHLKQQRNESIEYDGHTNENQLANLKRDGIFSPQSLSQFNSINDQNASYDFKDEAQLSQTHHKFNLLGLEQVQTKEQRNSKGKLSTNIQDLTQDSNRIRAITIEDIELKQTSQSNLLVLYIAINILWIIISALSTLPVVFWNNQNYYFMYVKLPYMALLITTLSYILIWYKFRIRKSICSKLQLTLTYIFTIVVVTLVIELIFFELQKISFENQAASTILKILPFLIAFPTAFIMIFITNFNVFKDKNIKLMIRSIFGPVLLVIQLLSTFYFSLVLQIANNFNGNLAPFVCAVYPYMIGYQKAFLFKVVEPFDMIEVYEFASLAFAAMPYRFIYLELDSWLQAGIIFGIKYFYKFLVYFLSLKYKKEKKEKKRRCWQKICFCKRKSHQNKVKAIDLQNMMSYLMMKKIKYLQLTEKIFQQKRLRAYVNVLINKATIRKEEQANAVDNVKSSDYYKLKSLIYSFKFFFIQTNDLCDLTTVLGLIFILRKLEIGFFGDLSDEAFERYALMSFIETALELIYTIITPYFIRRFTVYKQFYPSLGGQDTFFKNIMPFTGFVVFMFPLTFIKLLYEPQNQ